MLNVHALANLFMYVFRNDKDYNHVKTRFTALREKCSYSEIFWSKYIWFLLI